MSEAGSGAGKVHGISSAGAPAGLLSTFRPKFVRGRPGQPSFKLQETSIVSARVILLIYNKWPILEKTISFAVDDTLRKREISSFQNDSIALAMKSRHLE